MATETFMAYATNDGSPATGLSPSWDTLKDQDGTDQSTPSITEVGGGFYKFDVDIPSDDTWVGVIDFGSSIVNNGERYVPVVIKSGDTVNSVMRGVYVMPVYNENSDTVQFISYLMQNGTIVTSPTSCTIALYDTSHVEKFSVSTTNSSNGVFVVTKTTPELTAGDGYYVVATITDGASSYKSVETTLVLE